MSKAPKRRIRRPKPGDIASLRRVLWAAIRRLESISDDADTDTVLRATSALSTIAGVYLKAAEAHDFEQQLAEIRAQLNELRNTPAATTGPADATAEPEAAALN